MRIPHPAEGQGSGARQCGKEIPFGGRRFAPNIRIAFRNLKIVFYITRKPLRIEL